MNFAAREAMQRCPQCQWLHGEHAEGCPEDQFDDKDCDE